MNKKPNTVSWLLNAARSVLALVGVLALAVGLPMLLLASPSPIDGERGIASIVTAVLDDTQVFEQAVVSVIVAVAWVLWAYLLVAGAIEVVSAAQGRAVRVSGFGFGRRVVAPIVSGMMWSSTATSLAVSVVGGGALSLALADPVEAQEAPDSPPGLSSDGSDSAVGEHPIVVIDTETVLVDGRLARPHVIVERLDTMWDLADKHLGDPFRWTEIAELNVGLVQPATPTVTDPNLIWPKTVLLMPGDAVGLNVPTPAAVQALCGNPDAASPATVIDLASDEVTIVEGDTMWDLAAERLDDPFRWTEIAELNVGAPQAASPIVADPDLIWPGTVLQMPTTSNASNSEALIDDQDCEPEPDAPMVDETAPIAPVAQAPETTPSAPVSNSTESNAATVIPVAASEAARPWWLLAAAGAAAAVFAAAMAKLIAKKRNRARALGEEVDDDVAVFEDLGPQDRELRDHLLAASSSLSHWVTTVDATFLQVDADRTTAVFMSPVRPPQGCPWVFAREGDEGVCTWQLEHDLEVPGTGSQALYGIGENLFLNMEVVSHLGIEGADDELALSLLRRLIYDMAANFGDHHDLIVRVGQVADLDGYEVYGVSAPSTVEMMAAEMEAVMGRVDDAHERVDTVLIGDLRDEDAPFPTMVYIVDFHEAGVLQTPIAKMGESPGRYPFCVVVLGGSSGARWVARVEHAGEVVLNSSMLTLSPRVTPELMDRASARALGIATAGRFDGDGRFLIDPATAAADAPETPPGTVPEQLAAEIFEQQHGQPDLTVVDPSEPVDSQDESSRVEAGDIEASDDGVLVKVDGVVTWQSTNIDNADTESPASGDTARDSRQADSAGKDSASMHSDDSENHEADETGDADVEEEAGEGNAGSGGWSLNTDAESDDDLKPGRDLDQGDGAEGPASHLLENPIAPGIQVQPKEPRLPVVNPAMDARDLANYSVGSAAAFDFATQADVGVRLLGRVDIGVEGLSAAAVSAVTYVVVAGGEVERSELRHAVWDGREVTDRRFRSVLNEMRTAYGPRFTDLTGRVGLDVLSDSAAVMAAVARGTGQPWTIARAAVFEVLELVEGEPFASVSGRWWDWVDRNGDQQRRQVASQTCDALVEAAERARVENDWVSVSQLAGAGLKVSPVSQKLAMLKASAELAAGDETAAMSVVEAWESAFEAVFDEDAPETFRTAIRDRVRRTA